MADEQDPKVKAAYRALGAEEPPRALDEAILAASRRPARSWAQRWAVPSSLAAVLVLSVAVTLRIQSEAPELEKPASVREQAVAQAPAAPAPLKPEEQSKTVAPASPAPRERPAASERRAEPKAFADASPAEAKPPVVASAPQPQAARSEESLARSDAARGMESSVAGAAARQSEERVARDAEAASRASRFGPTQALAKRNQELADAARVPAAAAPVPAPAAVAPAPAAVAPAPAAKPAPRPMAVAESTPAQELERIAVLRAEGRHDEADKALAEFRKRNPDYRIPEETLKKVERP